MTPKIFRIIAQVSDIEKAADFYASLFGDAGKRVSSGRHYFDCGGVVFACFDPRADGDDFESHTNPDHIYFSVPDLERFFEKAKTLNCEFLEESITNRPWGERSFYAKDPFGNPICFVDESTVFKGD